MLNPATLAKQVEQPDYREGMAPPLSPSRKGKWIALILVVIAFIGGCKAWRGYSSSRQEPARLSEPPPPSRPFPTSRPSWNDAPEAEAVPPPKPPEIRLLWIAGDRVGVSVDGVTYAMATGDVIDGVTLGMFGATFADIHDGTTSRRFAVPYPFSAENSTGRGQGPNRGVDLSPAKNGSGFAPSAERPDLGNPGGVHPERGSDVGGGRYPGR